MTVDCAKPTAYLACPAQSFCVEHGVYFGETIEQINNLNLGDVYYLKPHTKWTPVSATDGDAKAFDLDVAANLPVRKLTTLAHLIFMTTTGRRADVCVTISDGHAYLVCDKELQTGLEYVLIDIQKRDVEFTPVVVPTPRVAVKPATVHITSNGHSTRLLG
ncbi:hypothetical protein ACG74X_08070 [Marivita sp. S0852]|uniref:hypothetical protein n=1 Tax=Marivita sp. S0852 TaxID=3373893 RepID=UPI0039824D2D